MRIALPTQPADDCHIHDNYRPRPPFQAVVGGPLFIALHPDSPVTAAALAMASVGFGASLVQQERLVSLSPDGPTGYVLGLQSSGMMTLQGVSAVILTVASVSSTARTRYDLPARASSPEHHLPIRSGRVRSASPAGRPEGPLPSPGTALLDRPGGQRREGSTGVREGCSSRATPLGIYGQASVRQALHAIAALRP